MPDGNDMMPDGGGPEQILEQLQPEVADGPLGIPVVKPTGAPDPPGGDLNAPMDMAPGDLESGSDLEDLY